MLYNRSAEDEQSTWIHSVLRLGVMVEHRTRYQEDTGSVLKCFKQVVHAYVPSIYEVMAI